MVNYIRKGTESLEHFNLVKSICKLFNLKQIKIIGNSNIKGKYFPDAIDKTTDYEVELVPKPGWLNLKNQKWNNKRKKVLILGMFNEIKESFDNIYFIDEDKVTKIK